MTTCNDCIYRPKCISFIVHGMGDDEIKGGLLTDIDKRCKDFKNKADVQEVKHGAWNVLQRRMNSDIVQCSVCREEFYYAKGHLQIGRMPYCPQCGAKMDGENYG